MQRFSKTIFINPIILVFIGYLSLNTLRLVPLCQDFNHFSGFLHYLCIVSLRLITFLPDIGSEIHKRSVEKGDIERDYAIKVAEQGVWAAAEVSKATALEQLQKRLACQHERAIKKLKKAQEKELKVCTL